MKNKINNQSLNKIRDQQGVTLIGLVIVVLVVVILAAATFIWIDPASQIDDAKDSKRKQDVLALANAISEYVNDNGGALPVLGAVTTNKKTLCRVQGGSSISCGGDTEDCLRIAHQEFYDKYLRELPIDPAKTNNTDTGYYLQKDSNGMLVIGACSTAGAEAVTKTTNVKVSCDLYGGGYCWYVTGLETTDCNTVCDSLNLDCIDKAEYGPDLDINLAPFCTLQLAVVSGYCYDDCIDDSTNRPPGFIDDYSTCNVQRKKISCDEDSDQGYFPICPCE